MLDVSSTWPYALMFLTFALGAAAGWYFNRARRKENSAHSQEPSSGVASSAHNPDLQAAEAELAQLRARLQETRDRIEQAQKEIQRNDDKYASLLLELDAQRGLLEESSSEIHTMDSDLKGRQSRSDALLTDIASNMEEIEVLTEVQEANKVQINRLTQQVQWQDAQLRMLRQSVKAKSAEIDEAKALLEQREADLTRLTRQRHQRETDIKRAKEQISQLDSELQEYVRRQKVQSPSEDGSNPPIKEPSHRPATRSRVPRLGAGPREQERPANDNQSSEDDLTAIPGLVDFYADQLRRQGVRTYEQLAYSRPEDIQKLLSIPGHYSPDIAAWIAYAHKLVRERNSGSPT